MTESETKAARGSHQLRLALAGFGRLARTCYLPALRRMAGVTIELVIDPLAASRAAAARQLAGVTLCNSLDEADARLATVDGLLVASPPDCHLEAWHAAVHHRLPVFMEKPFPLPQELPWFEQTGVAGVPLLMNFNRRQWPAYQQLRDWLRQGRIGRLRHAELYLHTDAARWSTVTRHRFDEAAGGVLGDLGSHALDLARFVSGEEVLRVRSATSPDSIAGPWEIHLELSSSAICFLSLAYARTGREQLQLTGATGTAWLDCANGQTWLGKPHSQPGIRNKLVDFASQAFRGLFPHQSMLPYTISQALGDFCASLRDGTPLSPGLADALTTTRVLAAVQAARASGQSMLLSQAAAPDQTDTLARSVTRTARVASESVP